MATELLIRRDLGKKAYRLKCRFMLPAYPLPSWVEKSKFETARMFVDDMAKQGFQYDPNKLPLHERGFKLVGPFPATPKIQTIKVPRRLSGREALLRVASGDRLLDKGLDYALTLPSLEMSENWEYEISAVFIKDVILAEIPDSHEEHEVNRAR